MRPNMKPPCPAWTGTLSVGAVASGSWGIAADQWAFTVVAWILLMAAVWMVLSDDLTSPLALASTATGVCIVGCAGAVAGYLVGNDLIAMGGLTVTVISFLVAVGELWGAA